MLYYYGRFEQVLQRIYYCVKMNAILLWKVWMGVTKDLLLGYNEYGMFVWVLWSTYYWVIGNAKLLWIVRMSITVSFE